MRSNVQISVLVGLVMATLYSTYAVILYVASDAQAFERHEATIGAVLLTYYAAGALGGLAVGLLLPLKQWFLGKALLGVVVSGIIFFCIFVAAEGPFWRWDAIVWRTLLLMVVVGSTIGSAVVWRTIR